MCSWSSWGSRTSSSARRGGYFATNKRPILADPSCLGLWSTRSAPALLLNYPHRKSTFIRSRKNHLILIYDHCLLFYHYSAQQRAWFLLSITSVGTGGSTSSEATPSPRLNQPHSLKLSSQGRCSSLHYLGRSLLNLLQFIDGIHVLWGPELSLVSHIWSSNAK